MAIVHSDRFARALIPGIYRNFDIGFNMRVSKRQMLFNVEGSNRAWEEEVGVGGMSSNPLNQWEDTGTIGAFDYYEGFGQRYTHAEYPVDLIVQRKFIDDESWGLVNRHVQKAGIAANNLMETQAADVFNNAQSSSHTWSDGKPLGDNAHPANSASSAPAQDNLFASTALTYENVVTVREAMRKWTDDQGNVLGVNPNLVLVPVELEAQAIEITKSTGRPGSSGTDTYFNNVNALRNSDDTDSIMYMSWPYLSSATRWFLIDTAMMKMSLHWFNRVPFGLTESKYENQVRYRYQFYGRWSYGPSDWRWVAVANS